MLKGQDQRQMAPSLPRFNAVRRGCRRPGKTAPKRKPQGKKPVAPHVAAPAHKTVNLALQGGGAHGAFTWGVLDRLLEERAHPARRRQRHQRRRHERGRALIYGMADGGRDGARELLRRFWQRISESARYTIFQPTPFDRLFGKHDLDHSAGLTRPSTCMTRLLSPYQLNPTDANPAARPAGRAHRLRAPAARHHGQALRLRHQRTHRQDPRLPARGDLRRRAAGLEPACRRCSAPSRSTARPIGTAATWAIPPCSRCSMAARPATSCWWRSTRSASTRCRPPRAPSWTASTTSPSTPR